jgi:hypothetical protein
VDNESRDDGSGTIFWAEHQKPGLRKGRQASIWSAPISWAAPHRFEVYTCWRHPSARSSGRARRSPGNLHALPFQPQDGSAPSPVQLGQNLKQSREPYWMRRLFPKPLLSLEVICRPIETTSTNFKHPVALTLLVFKGQSWHRTCLEGSLMVYTEGAP